MFTGLVEETGIIKKVRRRGGSSVLSIAGKRTGKSLKVDFSVAVEGVCLTVIGRRGTTFDVQAVEETLKKTTLGRLKEGDRVNLERPLSVDGRLGGHMVLGHVDGVGRVASIKARTSSWVFRIEIPEKFIPLLVPTGSIAVNGVSLTIADLKKNAFGVSIIPHTWKATTFSRLKEGDAVNLEFDVLGKYVVQLFNVWRKTIR